ncbi:hypothetical protein [uncultured Tateyamaria sp.]|uniref:hypothetical protein n=1 Tax=uncultured Tateyamaria sp. TaxID=455651 RepID=UPI00261675C2|nr:hypothetical protein [uncultured Tateyamaria sp.]
MIRFLKTFYGSDDGAVTVDWVVLCAAIVGLAIAIITGIQTGALTMTGNVGTFFETNFFQGE